MIAYKFLCTGAVGPFTGFQWPHGDWVTAAPPLDPCRSGIHACGVHALPEWLSDELWRIELGGETVEEHGVLVAERGRLVERVEAWDEAAAHELALACAARVRERAEQDAQLAPFAEDAETYAQPGGSVATVTSIARHVAELAEPGGLAGERSWQARWIAERAGL